MAWSCASRPSRPTPCGGSAESEGARHRRNWDLVSGGGHGVAQDGRPVRPRGQEVIVEIAARQLQPGHRPAMDGEELDEAGTAGLARRSTVPAKAVRPS